MAVNLEPPKELLAVPGALVGSAAAAVKAGSVGGALEQRLDVAVFSFADGADIGGAYTQSHFAAAPVVLARARNKHARAWVINSGNANAATGEPGQADADSICGTAARFLQIGMEQVQPFSTGVIGERLPVDRINKAVGECYRCLEADGWLDAAMAIMTTDTVPKGTSSRFDLDGETVTITGIAKGSGMIKPNMATMLAYMATDANVAAGVADMLVEDSLGSSFNRITVDGDTSTNDCYMLACTGLASHEEITGREHPLYSPLLESVRAVAMELAQSLVRDGEGATKFVEVRVTGGATAEDCLSVAYTVAESPLVKTALFAGDANWGRFCMAIGRAPIAKLDTRGVKLWLRSMQVSETPHTADAVQVADAGMMCDSYTDAAGAAVLAQDEFTVHIDLGAGQAAESVWTTDLSYDYVRINAEYRT
ncbi:MAG: bifunctional glutamate N-acetyltransferase/amino-acid acetyltransferase ArgJ [Pseudomonadales bacterium]|nr:bifunctional glutamate N-acetyltransferase/amino-acid acetyltransferase ArgJ [Pseudomonadales bacterium]